MSSAGGTGEGGLVVEGVNGRGNMELPFYMAVEQSGNVHGLLLETNSPFLAQYISAPGIQFHIQATAPTKPPPPQPSLRLHFFPGPTPADVFRQLNDHVRKIVDHQSSEGYKTANSMHSF